MVKLIQIILIYLVLGVFSTVGAQAIVMIRSILPEERDALAKEKMVSFSLLFLPLWPVFLTLILWSSFHPRCAYCGKRKRDTAAVRGHFLTCEKHPMRRVIEAAQELVDETGKIALPYPAASAEVELRQALKNLYQSAGVGEEGPDA